MRLTKATAAQIALPEGKAEALIFDQDLPGFGLRVRAVWKKTWMAQYRLGTKQRRVTLGTTETLEADEAPQTRPRSVDFAAGITGQIAASRSWRPTPKSSSFFDGFDDWCEEAGAR